MDVKAQQMTGATHEISHAAANPQDLRLSIGAVCRSVIAAALHSRLRRPSALPASSGLHPIAKLASARPSAYSPLQA